MNISYNRWLKLFLFCFGLFVAGSFCMKLLEPAFAHSSPPFTIIGLELDSKEKISHTLSLLNEHVSALLRYHLYFDFIFMMGAYLGIASLCMMGREKSKKLFLKKLLLALACLQVLAWACDIIENCCLLQWIKNPAIGDEFFWYPLVVYTKWIIALTGALVAIPVVIVKRNRARHN